MWLESVDGTDMEAPGPTRALALPFRMVCCCLAEQMSRLMPSMTWLLESTSFSFSFFPRKMVGTADGQNPPTFRTKFITYSQHC